MALSEDRHLLVAAWTFDMIKWREFMYPSHSELDTSVSEFASATDGSQYSDDDTLACGKL